MPKTIGICPGCNKPKKKIKYHHPETRQIVCRSCYKEGVRNVALKQEDKRKINYKKKIGICSSCNQGPKKITYRHPKTRARICPNCYSKIKRKEWRLTHPKPVKIKKLATRKVRGRNLYPTKESVIAALKTRTEKGKQNFAGIVFSEDAVLYRRARELGVILPRKEKKIRKPAVAKRTKKRAMLHEAPSSVPTAVISHAIPETNGQNRIIAQRKEARGEFEIRENYNAKKLVISILEEREAQGKENFPDVLEKEDPALFKAALSFTIELPVRGKPWIVCSRGDWVKNHNPNVPGIYDKIGQVIFSDKKEVIVYFGEPDGVKRVYQKWFNLYNITLHSRHPSNLAKITQKTSVPA